MNIDLDARTLNTGTSGPDTLGPVSYHASKEINHQLKTRTLNPRTLSLRTLGISHSDLKYTDSLKKRCSPHQGCGATEVYNKIFQQLILVL